MSDIVSTLPVTDTADGSAGSTVPSKVQQVGGKDASGNLQPLNLDASQRLIIAPLANTSIVKAQLQDNSGNGLNSDNGTLLVQDVINIAGQNRAQSVTTTAAEALGGSTILANRKYVSLVPTNGTIYWGYTTGVTPATGTPIFKNQLVVIGTTDNVHVYVIAATTIDVRISEGS